jgi:hypothetical protein
MTYVELHAHSAYSFLDGASQPEELAARAAELGYEVLALTDHDGVYGSLEFAHAAKHLGVRPITGAEVTLAGGSHATLLVESARGYANLCRLLTAAHAHTRDSTNREPSPPRLDQALLEELNEGLVCLSGCARNGLAVRDPNAAARLAHAFGCDRFYVELQRPFERGDSRRNARLRDLADSLGVQTVATGDVHAHDRSRVALQDVLVAVRCCTSLEGCEQERRGNHESVLLPPDEVFDRFPDDRDAVLRTGELAERLEFDLTEELGYRYPDFSDGAEPAIVQLRRVCESAFVERYSGLNGHKRRVRRRLEEELALIDELGLAGFFLLHWEVLELAREVSLEVRGPGSMRHVLPPGRGRGSSVGSLVCYLTGLSHVDPVANNLSLGRFLNRELASVPDIDLDFPRDIREKLIVRVVERYGSEHASLVAAFATYRSRGAIRDVGKALGLPYADLERLARLTNGWNAQRVADEIAALPDAATKLRSPRWRAFGALCTEIAGLPRHISQHPGGLVISSRPLVELDERPRGDDQPARVLGDVARQASDLRAECAERAPARRAELRRRVGKSGDLVGDALRVPAVRQAGEPLEVGVREAESLADVPDRAARAVGGEGRDERGVLGSIAFDDADDELLADVAREVEVDVRHRRELAVEEAAEREVVRDRVDVREAGQVADERTDGRAAPASRRQDVPHRAGPAHLERDFARELEHLPVEEEEAGEAELVDQRELLLEPAADTPLVAVEARVALDERALADAAELDDRRLGPVREVGVAVAELLRQVELEPLGELACAENGVAIIGKAVEHFVRRQEDGLVVAASLLLAALERGAAADGDENVLERNAAAVVRVDVPRGDRLDAERVGEVAQACVPARVAALEGALQLDVEAVAAECVRQPRRRVRIAHGKAVARAARKTDEPLVQLLEQCLVEPRRRRLAVRRVSRVRVRGGQEPAEVRVAARALHQ